MVGNINNKFILKIKIEMSISDVHNISLLIKGQLDKIKRKVKCVIFNSFCKTRLYSTVYILNIITNITPDVFLSD